MAQESDSKWIDRPGCVTWYAALLWIGAALELVALVQDVTGASRITSGAMLSILYGSPLLVVAVIQGIGLWQMKAWGWWLTVAVEGLSIGASVLGTLFLALTFELPLLLIFGLGVTVIRGYILRWFIDNRTMFDVHVGVPRDAHEAI